MTVNRHTRAGAALVIALGFLAVLSMLVIGYAARARADRLAGRQYLDNARARQLLRTAIAEAMASIDRPAEPTARRPLAWSSRSPAFPLRGSLDVATWRDYAPLGDPRTQTAFDAALASAGWKQIQIDGTNVGRVAFMVVDTTGLLDANAVGGRSRGAGRSPKEIQLSPALIPELAPTANLVQLDGSLTQTNHAGHALIHNRDTAWKTFDTLRDLKTLNDGPRGGALTGDIATFNVCSYAPAAFDDRLFMGTNTATLAESTLRAELEAVAPLDADFVLNQLRDYLDPDSLPEDADGAYTDLSVEAAPLINEVVLTCDLHFSPLLEPVNRGDGSVVFEVVSVAVSNAYALNVEVWHPFTHSSTGSYALRIPRAPVFSGHPLLDEVPNWRGSTNLPASATQAFSTPQALRLFSASAEASAGTARGLVDLFDASATDISIPLIECATTRDDLVDRVINARLPLNTALETKLLPLLEPLASELFDPNLARDTSIQLVVGTACVDPRLNWNGLADGQWKPEMDALEGRTAAGHTLNTTNTPQLAAVTTPDNKAVLHVRDQDRVDSPWELTYFLEDPARPWRTIQLLESNDPEHARRLLDRLSTYVNGPPTSGRVNPHGARTNAIASLFMDMPISGYAGARNPRRFTAAQAKTAAELLLAHVDQYPDWPANATTGFDLQALAALMGDVHPWSLEAYFRNAIELFNPRDTSYTLLVAAQVGADWDGNGIQSEEVSATQQAVVTIWRDPITGKAAITFYGLNDSLRSTLGAGQSWGDILQAFSP